MWDFVLWLILLLLVALGVDFSSVVRGLVSLMTILAFLFFTGMYIRAAMEP